MTPKGIEPATFRMQTDINMKSGENALPHRPSFSSLAHCTLLNFTTSTVDDRSRAPANRYLGVSYTYSRLLPDPEYCLLSEQDLYERSQNKFLYTASLGPSNRPDPHGGESAGSLSTPLPSALGGLRRSHSPTS
jgi:hypothetical protein